MPSASKSVYIEVGYCDFVRLPGRGSKTHPIKARVRVIDGAQHLYHSAMRRGYSLDGLPGLGIGIDNLTHPG